MIQFAGNEQNNKHIIKYFNNMGIEYFCEPMPFGDYTNPTNEKQIVIERKKNLIEFANNCGKGHLRFKNELKKAKDNGYEVVVLIEQQFNYNDLKTWVNPKAKNKTRVLKDGSKVARPNMTGEQMWKICEAWKQNYPVRFIFCDKKTSGAVIGTILRDK